MWYGIVFLSLVQGFGIVYWLEFLNVFDVVGVVVGGGGWGFKLMVVFIFMMGICFLMWLGE